MGNLREEIGNLREVHFLREQFIGSSSVFGGVMFFPRIGQKLSWYHLHIPPPSAKFNSDDRTDKKKKREKEQFQDNSYGN